jgi:hypothetical protein
MITDYCRTTYSKLTGLQSGRDYDKSACQETVHSWRKLPRQGYTPISRTHPLELIMSTEVCHVKTRRIYAGVQTGSG